MNSILKVEKVFRTGWRQSTHFMERRRLLLLRGILVCFKIINIKRDPGRLQRSLGKKNKINWLMCPPSARISRWFLLGLYLGKPGGAPKGKSTNSSLSVYIHPPKTHEAIYYLDICPHFCDQRLLMQINRPRVLELPGCTWCFRVYSGPHLAIVPVT